MLASLAQQQIHGTHLCGDLVVTHPFSWLCGIPLVNADCYFLARTSQRTSGLGPPLAPAALPTCLSMLRLREIQAHRDWSTVLGAEGNQTHQLSHTQTEGPPLGR